MDKENNGFITLADRVKKHYALNDDLEQIAERIEAAMFTSIESETAKTENYKLKTLYKTEAHKGDWLQDQTGLYEIINITPDGAEVKEVFFIDPDDYTSTDNYYLGEEIYTLSKWEVRHAYKATFNNQ